MLFVSALVFVIAWGWWLTHPDRHARRSSWPAVLVALGLPFTVPAAWIYPRIFATVWGITLAMKSHALRRDGPRDPEMRRPWPRFVLWMLVPPATRWPRGPQDRARVRRAGARRLGRALAKTPGIAILLGMHAAWPGLHASAWVEAAWALWLTWLAVSAITDTASGVVMVAGVDVAENFRVPPLARSPRDFWARRWNLFVHEFAMRYVFVPAGGRRHPITTTAVVFIGSGLMHEYFIVAAMGQWSRFTGAMLAFFVLQGAVVMGQMARDRARRRSRRPRPATMPRSLAIVLHVTWLTITGPLFFGPLGEMLART